MMDASRPGGYLSICLYAACRLLLSGQVVRANKQDGKEHLFTSPPEILEQTTKIANFAKTPPNDIV
jgi:hypothetical protein